MTQNRSPIDILALQSLTPDDIDSAPYGFIVLYPDGRVARYNDAEAQATGRQAEDVVGKNFFQDVAPCARVKEFEGVFQDFVARRIGKPAHEFDFVFRFTDRPHQRVQIRLIRSAGAEDQVLVVLTRTGAAA